jgi:hypothetical protein
MLHDLLSLLRVADIETSTSPRPKENAHLFYAVGVRMSNNYLIKVTCIICPYDSSLDLNPEMFL